jgi:hypothetical protein
MNAPMPPAGSRGAQRCVHGETVVAAFCIGRGESRYPGAATSAIVKDNPGFIQEAPPIKRPGSLVGVAA